MKTLGSFPSFRQLYAPNDNLMAIAMFDWFLPEIYGQVRPQSKESVGSESRAKSKIADENAITLLFIKRFSANLKKVDTEMSSTKWSNRKCWAVQDGRLYLTKTCRISVNNQDYTATRRAQKGLNRKCWAEGINFEIQMDRLQLMKI